MDKKKYLEAYFEKGTQCIKALRSQLPEVKILTSQTPDLEYFEASQVFNTRLQQNPLAIVYCEKAEHVSKAYKIAIEHQIPIRVRAGGHDHEGESSGTNVVTIDVSKMTNIIIDKSNIDKSKRIAKIGAGCKFIDLTKALADQNVMIAHGTCATVCVTGFTLGGGWGPWTRKMGMNCEHLKGATLVLGDGSIVDVDEEPNGEVPDLLWALRGGGGLSYGIVTELRLEIFDLPQELIKFELQWNHYDKKNEYPANYFHTLNILKAWEAVILEESVLPFFLPSLTLKLIGTNLKINACPPIDALSSFDYTKINHNCCMYGYWDGSEEELINFVRMYFANVLPPYIKIDGEGGKNPKHPKEDYIVFRNSQEPCPSFVKERVPNPIPRSAKAFYTSNDSLMGNWGRESFAKVDAKINDLDQGAPIPPDYDDPAPHKITSRLVNHEGLSDEGYKQLLLSLTSPWIKPENRRLGLFSYVTLGAIIGDYYRSEKGKNNPSAFPYKDKLYTIQYQTWWNEPDKHEYPDPMQEGGVYTNINLAMDWMDAARNFHIPNTSGAFISFKDIAVPTSVYFDKSYERLKEIKIKYAKDPDNHLRTRKTIM
jgi:FAD binding domain/Berberine and berberine like